MEIGEHRVHGTWKPATSCIGGGQVRNPQNGKMYYGGAAFSRNGILFLFWSYCRV